METKGKRNKMENEAEPTLEEAKREVGKLTRLREVKGRNRLVRALKALDDIKDVDLPDNATPADLSAEQLKVVDQAAEVIDSIVTQKKNSQN